MSAGRLNKQRDMAKKTFGDSSAGKIVLERSCAVSRAGDEIQRYGAAVRAQAYKKR